MVPSLCVFCGSSPGNRSEYADVARKLGSLLARRGIQLVYGGAQVGLMGLLADSCLAEGGQVVGIIPQSMVDREIAHPGLTRLEIVGTMHERKARMAQLSHAFLALPGGYGTWEEFFEVLTWSHLRIHSKPCALLNLNGFYNPLFALADTAVQEGFLRPAQRKSLLVETDPNAALNLLFDNTHLGEL